VLVETLGTKVKRCHLNLVKQWLKEGGGPKPQLKLHVAYLKVLRSGMKPEKELIDPSRAERFPDIPL
jgi:hypothetical protein